MTAPGQLVEVHLLQVPVPLWSQAQQLFDELMREFALAAAQADDDDQHQLPARLTRLMHDLTARYGTGSDDQEEQLHAAAAQGVPVLERLVYAVPQEAGPAMRELGDLLDEADAYCRDGQHLLTLAAPPEVLAFRRWYLSAFVTQLAGAAPVPWPEHDGAWPPGS